MLDLASIAFNVPWLIEQQIRLFAKNLLDEYQLTIYDNSSEPWAATLIEKHCLNTGTPYIRLWPPQRLHHYALNIASQRMLDRGADIQGFIDHDVFPSRPTSLQALVQEAGFLTVGQYHLASGVYYPWPGFFFITREWRAGRTLNFDGLRGMYPEDDGDTGSCLHSLMKPEDWLRMASIHHSYGGFWNQGLTEHLQSYGYENIGDFIHLTNGSGWLVIDRQQERERLAQELIRSL